MRKSTIRHRSSKNHFVLYFGTYARAKETKTKLALFGELRVTLNNLKNSLPVTPTKWRNFPDQTDKSNLKRWFKNLYQLS